MMPDPWLARWLPLPQARAQSAPVLEIGCSCGDDTVVLAAAGLQVHAFALSPAAAGVARARVPSAALFTPGCNCISVQHAVIHKYHHPKALWEVVAERSTDVLFIQPLGGRMPSEASTCFLGQLRRMSACLGAVLVGHASVAAAASFPCAQAQSRVEKLVCSAPALSDLDEALSRYYAGANVALRHAQPCLAADQRAWLRTVRDACPDEACLKAAYLNRLAVLHGVQPGVSAQRSLELPAVPPLAWIVAPASDQVAAPRNRPTRAWVAQGRIVDDIAAGDGFVLQQRDGRKIVIMSAMLYESPTVEALTSLTRLPDAKFEIRGRVDLADKRADAFAAGQCAYVYRLSP